MSLSVNKTINTLLVTCIMIIKLRQYICFLKQAHMENIMREKQNGCIF